jgi:hypothetical protein
MRHECLERTTECRVIRVQNRKKAEEGGWGHRGVKPVKYRYPQEIQHPKANRPALALSPGRPAATVIGENQATVRPVFIFAATSTEIRQPIAR